MYGNKAAKQVPAARRQSSFGWRIVISRSGVQDFVGLWRAHVRRRFGKVVLSMSKIIGSARVHRWTPPTDPVAFSYKSQSLGKTFNG
jgi:hypothetical protein